MEEDLDGRRPQWKTTSMEDDLNGRRSKWKTPSMEDDLKVITPLPYLKQITLVSLASKFSTELGPAQPQLVSPLIYFLSITNQKVFENLKNLGLRVQPDYPE